MPPRRDSQSGFTIVEVLVAILIVAIGAMATFGLFSSATRNAERAKETQVALEEAEQELEYLRSLKAEQLALTATPPPSSNPVNPDYRVNGAAQTFALEREPLGSYKELVHNGGVDGEAKEIKGGIVSPGPTTFTSGDVSGEVYRYIVWRNDENCSEAKCPGTKDYKQIVVAVKLDSPPNLAAERGYVEVQSKFINPRANAESGPIPNSEGKVVTAQQFFLTDTPCSATGSTERQEITGDHLLHNTLGTCASGLQNGSEKEGAPDALMVGAPPDPAPEDPTVPALYDYSSDYYLEPNPDTDKGLQILEDNSNGCNYNPTGTTHPDAAVHRWVTDKMAAPFVMSKKVTLEIYTRTLNDALYTGTLCVYLFKREESGSPPKATDTMLVNATGSKPYWEYTPEGNEYWPRYEWAKVRLTMNFQGAPKEIPTGARLGLALSIERNNTQAEAIPVVYDNPNYPSRIEVDTTTPLNGG
jgi:prepilin-type N-terminal cleavage/methylation domain-containing protein